MNSKTLQLFFATLIATGVGGCKMPNSQDHLITIDLSDKYPKKELVIQDFMDVEYIPLETKDEFLTQGDVAAIGNKYVLVKNRINDGDIYVFDLQTGEALRKINKKGQSNEEYTDINGVVLDEDNNEIFVNCTHTKRIYVYNLSGRYKRSLEHVRGAEYLYNLFNYDKDNLICYDTSGYTHDGEKRNDKSYHLKARWNPDTQYYAAF